jgi:hypothetical protein
LENTALNIEGLFIVLKALKLQAMDTEHLQELIQDRGLISGRDKKFFLRSLSRPDLGPKYKVPDV